MAILIDKNSRIAIQGITGREASMVARHTLAYGTPVLAGITPGKGGQEIHGIPIYDSLKAACQEHGINTTAVYVPPAFVYDAVLEAIDNNVKLIWIATENVPQHDALKFLHLAKEAAVIIVGPNSVGIISPGERMKLGAIGGDNPDRCFPPGRIGVISRSGGMTAETSWTIKRAGFGVSTAISIGGDSLIGSTPCDLLALFQEDEGTDAVVMFSEPGTTFEEEVAEMIAAGRFTKPLISYIAGRFTETMPENTVFGHAGAIISQGRGRPSQKEKCLREAGAYVVRNLDEIGDVLRSLFGEEKGGQ
ncbi:MAG: succinyl-CoA synthetase alpha subunit [Clostridia bacterium]|nr:succinyl-CoA synthetase alpha subunit [Clostridia bacterium]